MRPALLAVAVAGLGLIAGCGTTIDGRPSAAGSAASAGAATTPTGSGTAAIPPGGPPSASGSTGAASTAAGRRPVQHLSVTGLTSRRTYAIDVWATDRVTDCRAHSYGAPMRAYFAAHPCRSATRRLVTLRAGGRLVAMSIVVVECGSGPSDDLYRWAGRFSALEKKDGTGSINDLLREGGRIPGAGRSIPASEAFHVVGQDLTVVVFDAWYLDGATRDQDRTLVDLENDLFLTAATGS